MDILDFVSVMINIMTGGKYGEPFCSRVARNSILVGKQWCYIECTINFAFTKIENQHCWKCHLRYLRAQVARFIYILRCKIIIYLYGGWEVRYLLWLITTAKAGSIPAPATSLQLRVSEVKCSMQSFLPYPNFYETARVLDNKRLGKQRVETMQILQTLLYPKSKAWQNHPAVKMWKGHEDSLVSYQLAICDEWKRRGFKDTCWEKTIDIFYKYAPMTMQMSSHREFPKWLGNSEFHASHRSNLLRKNPEWYNRFGWSEPDNIPYVWPTKQDIV